MFRVRVCGSRFRRSLVRSTSWRFPIAWPLNGEASETSVWPSLPARAELKDPDQKLKAAILA